MNTVPTGGDTGRPREVVDDRREIWLTWMHLPWDVIRQDIAAEMRRRGMTWDDLQYELRSHGYRVSHGTVGNWLRGVGKGPSLNALQALVSVLAQLRSGRWVKP